MPASSPPTAARISMITSLSSLGSLGTSITRRLFSRRSASAVFSVAVRLQVLHHLGVALTGGHLGGFGGLGEQLPAAQWKAVTTGRRSA